MGLEQLLYCSKVRLPLFFLFFIKQTFPYFQENTELSRVLTRKVDIMTFYKRKEDRKGAQDLEGEIITFYQVKII